MASGSELKHKRRTAVSVVPWNSTFEYRPAGAGTFACVARDFVCLRAVPAGSVSAKRRRPTDGHTRVRIPGEGDEDTGTY